MTVSNELIDRLLADYKKPEDLIGQNGLLKQLTKRLVERALEVEMAEHLGHAKNEPVANPRGNTRNGKSKKTLKGDFGELPIDIPRDREGSFEPSGESCACACAHSKRLDKTTADKTDFFMVGISCTKLKWVRTAWRAARGRWFV
jgi:hypothetical protein